ncbi:hypothetical protein AB0N09_17580 [Streptomyces erythrochromogenes]
MARQIEVVDHDVTDLAAVAACERQSCRGRVPGGADGVSGVVAVR